MKTILKIVVAGIILMVLFIGGCTALVGGVASEVGKEMDKEQAKHAITKQEFKSLEMGLTLSEVKEKFGNPDPEMTQKYKADGMKDTTVYYNVEGGDIMDQYQLSFTDGALSAKAKW